jgi:hypothetical protein
MHPDIVEDKPGNCPLCKMALVPVRLESVWTCPVHAAVVKHERGTCPICKRDLIQMTMALTWTCPEHADINAIQPGRCPDGTPMVATRTLRPHGNHNPQHGGQFFMAPDNWHHLEGTYPRTQLFRLYLYDDYARPLPPDQIKQVSARVVTKETFDSATRTTREIATAPLVASPTGGYLEARVTDAGAPAEMSAKVRFKQGGDEYRFDFTFPAVTMDPAPRAIPSRTGSAAARPPRAATSTPPGPRARTTSPTPNGSTTAPVAAAPAPDPSLVQLPIPDSVPEILSQLATRKQQVGELIERGNFAAVFVPAFQAKDLAIALEQRLDTLSAERREAAAPAIERVVRSAWLLDSAGDLGNRQQLQDGFAMFGAAVDDITRAFRP